MAQQHTFFAALGLAAAAFFCRQAGERRGRAGGRAGQRGWYTQQSTTADTRRYNRQQRCSTIQSTTAAGVPAATRSGGCEHTGKARQGTEGLCRPPLSHRRRRRLCRLGCCWLLGWLLGCSLLEAVSLHTRTHGQHREEARKSRSGRAGRKKLGAGERAGVMVGENPSRGAQRLDGTWGSLGHKAGKQTARDASRDA